MISLMIDSKSSQRKLFDAQLWALHRNSLLFSGLLLVLCLPGITVSPDQTLYWIRISGATLSNLRAISALVAAYAFVAFLLEWLHEVWPFWREQEGHLRTIAESIDQVAKLSAQAIQDQRAKLNEAVLALHEAEEALKACVSRGYIATDAVGQHLQCMLGEAESEQLTHKIYRRLPADDGSGPRFPSSETPNEATLAIVRSTVSRTVHELAMAGMAAFGADQSTTARAIGDKLQLVRGEFKVFESTKSRMDLSPLGPMRWSLRGHRGSLVARVWIIALGAPLILFIAGMFRFIWLLGTGY